MSTSKNIGMASAVALVGVGIILNAVAQFTTNAQATPAPAPAMQDKGEPTIVWYSVVGVGSTYSGNNSVLIYR